ncbi:MAG: hypothetical protein ACM3X0_16625 [Bacteroidota bacterium]
MIDFWFTGFVLVVSVLLAVGVSLLLVGYLYTLPASFSFGWRAWMPTLVLPLLGPLFFAWSHRPEYSRAARQLLAGIVLLGLAGAMLYGGGPYLIDHMAAGGR